jgi:hypothetical protein
MTESVQTTLEEASRCPKCAFPGELIGKTPVSVRSPDGSRRNIAPGTMLHHFMCKNDRCKWYDTICRLVQVNPDGSIPIPSQKRIKQFPAIPDRAAQVDEILRRQLGLETGDTTAEVNR